MYQGTLSTTDGQISLVLGTTASVTNLPHPVFDPNIGRYFHPKLVPPEQNVSLGSRY